MVTNSFGCKTSQTQVGWNVIMPVGHLPSLYERTNMICCPSSSYPPETQRALSFSFFQPPTKTSRQIWWVGLGLFSKRDHSLRVKKITVWLIELNVNSLELVFLVTSDTWGDAYTYTKKWKPKAPNEKQNPPPTPQPRHQPTPSSGSLPRNSNSVTRLFCPPDHIGFSAYFSLCLLFFL